MRIGRGGHRPGTSSCFDFAQHEVVESTSGLTRDNDMNGSLTGERTNGKHEIAALSAEAESLAMTRSRIQPKGSLNLCSNKRICLYLILPLLIAGCGWRKKEMHEKAPDKIYFESPKQAVPKITELLQRDDFETLAKCYDLSGSDIPLSDLQSGKFFVRTERPEMSHPGEFWRYKHPFSPGFEYGSMRPSKRENVYVVTVRVSIDQGADSPMQEGFSLFYMIQSDKGWQLLPDQVAEDSGPELPDQ